MTKANTIDEHMSDDRHKQQRQKLLELASSAHVSDGCRCEIATRGRRRARALGLVEFAANLGATFFGDDELIGTASARARATVGRELTARSDALRLGVAVDATVWADVHALAVRANDLRLKRKEEKRTQVMT